MPKVSVAMCAYNKERFVGEAVSSILSQTFKDFEFVIVNDGSTDNTLEMIKLYSGDDKRVKIINNERNLGLVGGRNATIKEATGEYIAGFDADDISLPERLERQVDFLDRNIDVALVGTSGYTLDEDGDILRVISVIEDNDEIQKRLLEANCFIHSSVMFRREVIEKIGGYRDEFEYAEDYDFILRIAEYSKLHNLSEILCNYRLNRDSITFNKFEQLKRYTRLASYLARERRAARPENLEMNKARIVGKDNTNIFKDPLILKLSRNRCGLLTLSGRYYGMGCIQLYKGDLKKARDLFFRSLRYSLFNIKAYVGLFLTLLPFGVIKRVRFMFRKTVQYYRELEGDKL